MSAPKGYGLEAANDQPAKTLTKRTTDFIAQFDRNARMNFALNVLFTTLAMMAALMVLEVLI